MNDLEILTKLLKWNKWKRFKWNFYTTKKRLSIIKKNVELKVETHEDKEGNFIFTWEFKKRRVE